MIRNRVSTIEEAFHGLHDFTARNTPETPFSRTLAANNPLPMYTDLQKRNIAFTLHAYPIPMMPAIAADCSKFVNRAILELQSCAFTIQHNHPFPSTSPLSLMVHNQPCPDIYSQSVLASMEEHLAFFLEGPAHCRGIQFPPLRSPRDPGHLILAISAFVEKEKAAQLFHGNPIPADYCQAQAFYQTFMAGASGGVLSEPVDIARLVYMYRAIVEDPLPGTIPTVLDAATEKWIADTCYKMAASLLGYPLESEVTSVSQPVLKWCDRKCRNTEEQPGQFKKCKQCIIDKVRYPHYYCSKSCQVQQWRFQHRYFHQAIRFIKNIIQRHSAKRHG